MKIANRFFFKYGTVDILGDNNNKSKPDSGGNYEEIEFG
jgi:hypothetical protein